MRPSAFGAAIAIGLGCSAWALHRDTAGLVPPVACAGALDAIAVLAAGFAHDAPLGSWLLRANSLLLAPLLALVVVLLQRWSGSWVIAGSVGLAVAVEPLLDPPLSPFDPAVAIAAAAAFIAARASAPKTVIAAFACSSLMTPPAALPLALLAAWYQRQSDGPTGRMSWTRAAVAAAVVGLPAAAIVLVLPPLPPQLARAESACLLPLSTPAAREIWRDGARAAIGSAGPYGLALAALGAFVVGSRHLAAVASLDARTLWVLLSYAVLATVGVQPGQSLLRNFGPLLIVYWICVAAGLDTVVRACRGRAGGWMAAAIFVLMLPLFQVAAQPPRAPSARTFGLERASLNGVRHLLAVLPDASVLVEEDATIATLLRASRAAWRRMGKRLELAPPAPEAFARVPSGANVYALPHSQTSLQWLGIRQADADLPGISGVAALTAGGACERVRPRWLDVESVPASTARAFAIVANDVRDEHAVVVYAITSAEPRPAVLGASDSDRIGVHWDVYSLVNADDRARLEAIARDDQLPREIASVPLFAARLEFWRAAALPAVTAVRLGVPAREFLVRASSAAASDLVCPAFPYSARDLQIWQ